MLASSVDSVQPVGDRVGEARGQPLPQQRAHVGAAAGAAAGYFVDKDGKCSGYDKRGRLDYDCYGTRGYPARPPRR